MEIIRTLGDIASKSIINDENHISAKVIDLLKQQYINLMDVDYVYYSDARILNVLRDELFKSIIDQYERLFTSVIKNQNTELIRLLISNLDYILQHAMLDERHSELVFNLIESYYVKNTLYKRIFEQCFKYDFKLAKELFLMNFTNILDIQTSNRRIENKFEKYYI